MKKTSELCKGLISGMLIAALMFCLPAQALAQSPAGQTHLLQNGTQMVLRVTENVNTKNMADTGTIPAAVDSDVYSTDGTTVLIPAGTPAFIEFTAEPNGSWGKAGKICLTHATTKTIDNRQVSLRLSSCRNGGSKLGGVIALSVLLFPIGLISGCMKGSMPKISQGTTYNASVMQDITVR